MTRSILFRIDNSENSGIGHVTRCHGIGEQLKTMGYEVYYALDNSWPSELTLKVPLTERLIILNSHRVESEQKFLLDFMAKNEILVLVLDSYKVTNEWYHSFDDFRINLFFLDDSNSLDNPRVHKIPYGIRYFGDREQQKVSLGTEALKNVVLASQSEPLSKLPKNPAAKRIFVYMGSNPQECEVKCVISGVTRALKNFEAEIEIALIKSKYVNQDLFKDLFYADKLSPTIQFLFLDFCESLLPIISSCDLVIGAANSIIYQTSVCLVPQITFSLNPTQKNEDFQLEQIGHYFNLGSLDEFDDEHFSSFLSLALGRLSILKSLLSNAPNRPGFEGAKNIAAYIHARSTHSSKIRIHGGLNEVSENRLLANEDFTVREAKTSDVNLILEGRNIEATRKFMISTKEISKSSHYTWWFTNKRENFIGLLGDTPCIYIWHEVREIRGEKFLVGGWTPLCKALHFSIILGALKWQLRTTSTKYPGLKWLAAVHKDNTVTQFLVNRIGFKEANSESRFFDFALEMFFAGVPTDEYLLYFS